MSAWDTSRPLLVRELHKLEFDYADGNGIDFEPYETFLSSGETSRWFSAWTGNTEATGAELRVFGQDGSGGYAAFWLALDSKRTLEQPVVFLGSEGQAGVVAANFDDYLWLLAGGIGPCEAVLYTDLKREANPLFTRFAVEHSATRALSPAQIVAKARNAYPEFERWIESLCR